MTENNLHSKELSKSRLKLSEFITNPSEFYNHSILKSIASQYGLIFLVGLAGAIERFDNKYTIAASLSGYYDFAGSNWHNYWFVMALGGIVGGYLIWLINGWWYNMRLKLVGAQNSDKQIGRLIMMSNSLIRDVPIILIALITTLRYENYYSAFLDSDLLSFVLYLITILMTVLSVINSYRTVREYYKVKGLKVLIWFLILPLFYLVGIPIITITTLML